MKGAVEVAQKFNAFLFIGVLLVVGMTACVVASSPPKKEIPDAEPPAVLSVTVPESGWRLRIERVLERDDEIWILAKLQRSPGASAQMIQQAQAPLPSGLPAKPRKVFVEGKTWHWPNPEPYEFVPALAPVIQQAGPARVLYPKESGG